MWNLSVEPRNPDGGRASAGVVMRFPRPLFGEQTPYNFGEFDLFGREAAVDA